jgi:hypothetical protein
LPCCSMVHGSKPLQVRQAAPPTTPYFVWAVHVTRAEVAVPAAGACAVGVAGTHTDAPAAAEKPAGQAVAGEWSGAEAYVPAVAAVQVVAPALELAPEAQTTAYTAAPAGAALAQEVPVGHGAQAGAPGPDIVPGAHYSAWVAVGQ